jgi:hypothetical protein
MIAALQHKKASFSDDDCLHAESESEHQGTRYSLHIKDSRRNWVGLTPGITRPPKPLTKFESRRVAGRVHAVVRRGVMITQPDERAIKSQGES